MSKDAFKIKISLIVLLLTLGLLESGSYIALRIKALHDKTFAELYDPAANTARFSGRCEDYAQTLELHPYLSFVHNKKCAGVDYRTNNVGMLNQDVDFTGLQFYSIGVFGGSVAAQFAGFTVTPQLEEILNGCFRNRKGKPFRVLNFADGGWKQPQQVIALVLFGDYIDAAVSIEGFNEHYAIGNSTDLSVPANNFASLIHNDAYANLYFVFRHIKDTLIGKSNFLKLLVVAYRQALERRSQKHVQTLYQNYALPPAVDPSKHNVKRYGGFVRSFEAVADAKRIYSLIVLQPSPLQKKLARAEADKVGPLNYEKQYVEIAGALAQAKRFLDLSDLFKDTDKPIFADQIHFVRDFYLRSYGNYVMASRIAARLLEDNQISLGSDDARSCVSRFDRYG